MDDSHNVIEEKILDCLTPYGCFTWDDVRKRSGIVGNFDRTLLDMVKDGRILTERVTDSRYRYPVAGYKLPHPALEEKT